MSIGVSHINLSLTGGTDQFVTTPTWVRWFSCQLSNGASGTVAYVGDSSVTGPTDCSFEAAKGQICAITGSMFAENHVGDQFDLSQMYVVGTMGDDFTVAFEVVTG